MKSIKGILDKVLFFGLSALMLAACRQEEGKILSQNKMAAVLTDVYLTEAMLQNIDKKKKTDWSRGLKDVFFQDLAYRRILEKHHISEEDFYNSVAHYSQQYKVYAKIYAQVELNLQAIQAEVNERDKLEAKLRELAQEQAALIDALDTASYIKWFEIWAADSVRISPDTLVFHADSMILSDTSVLQTDNLSLYPLNCFNLYNTSFWPQSCVRDSSEWTVVDFEPEIKSEKALPGYKNANRLDLKKTIKEGEN